MRFTLEHVRNVIEDGGDKLLSTEYKNYRQKLNITCHKCNKNYEQCFQLILKGYWCTEDCKVEKQKNRAKGKGHSKYLLEEVASVIEKGGDTLISTSYKSAKDKIEIRCGSCSKNYMIAFSHYNNGNIRCKSCYIETRKLTNQTFKDCVEERGDTLIDTFVDTRTKVKIICGICKNTFNITPNWYRNGSGCKPCGIDRTRLTYEQVKTRVESFGDKLLSKEYVNVKTLLQIECGNCGEEFEKSADHYNPFCKFCNSTSLEKMMITYLRKNSINYDSEKTYTNCRSIHGSMFRYDFYLPDTNCLVECDGEQHFRLIKKFKMKDCTVEETFEIIQERDRQKTKYCIDNNLKLIRISYLEMKKEEHFKEVMDKILGQIGSKNVIFSNDSLYRYLN